MSLLDLIRDRIRERGPMTVAAFMDLALYHPELGYYARGPRATGAAGDAASAIDAGPLFGELLAAQLAEMASLLGPPGSPFTLVDAGASDGRLAHAVLRGLKKLAPRVCTHTHLHLVERSATARAAQHTVLAAWTEQAMPCDALPDEFQGVIIARELLEAMPVHRVVMRETGLHEIYVDIEGDTLVLREGALSSPAIASQLSASGTTPGMGACADVSLAAVDWVRDAAKRLSCGFILLIDRGDDAAHLYSRADSSGTLTCRGRDPHVSGSGTPWLERPGELEIAAQVDFTSARAAAEAEGCISLGLIDQTHFLMALAGPRVEGFDEMERHAFNALVLPRGPGSTTKVLVLAKGMGTPLLRCCSGAIGLS